eukprot:NODE_242_length_11906_cov_0.577454.p4 type:complete len:165 gc:universal NODE_242_length_11906_cov_0.577454:1351-1845(+)
MILILFAFMVYGGEGPVEGISLEGDRGRDPNPNAREGESGTYTLTNPGEPVEFGDPLKYNLKQQESVDTAKKELMDKIKDKFPSRKTIEKYVSSALAIAAVIAIIAFLIGAMIDMKDHPGTTYVTPPFFCYEVIYLSIVSPLSCSLCLCLGFCYAFSSKYPHFT